MLNTYIRVGWGIGTSKGGAFLDRKGNHLISMITVVGKRFHGGGLSIWSCCVYLSMWIVCGDEQSPGG
jgi:hypothetical protein